VENGKGYVKTQALKKFEMEERSQVAKGDKERRIKQRGGVKEIEVDTWHETMKSGCHGECGVWVRGDETFLTISHNQTLD